MKKYLILTLLLNITIHAGNPSTGLSKREYYNQFIAPSKGRAPLAKPAAYDDRKRSVLDKGNMVLRLSNAAIYGYDRWGLNHEFPAGSMMTNGCCTYYWTQAPMVGALKNGVPSVSVGVRGSVRDSEEEFEPLPGYDAGYSDTDQNIGIAFSDMEQSWPAQWPIEADPTGTFASVLYDANGNANDTLYFPGVEPELGPEGFPDAPCGLGVQADREAYFVVTDNDPTEGNTYASNNGVGPLNVRIDTWVLNYANTFGNDGLIFIQKMTNVGKDTLRDLYFGIAGDPDAPEQGSAEWTDDLCMLISADDPHIAEKLSDTTDAHLLENLAIVWDPDDESSGFVSSGLGWIGLKFLECTKYNMDGSIQPYDISTFYTYEYSEDSQSDNDAYNIQMSHGIQEPHNAEPPANDLFQKPYSYGPDITWIIAAGGPEQVTTDGDTIPEMAVAPGEFVIFTFADFMGINEADLLRNAKVFQSLYDNNCASPQPPKPPVVHAVPQDGKVALFWDNRSEQSIDPVTGNNAFQGYRIYRSSDRGNTWGSVVTDFNGNPTDFYKPLAIFDKMDGMSGAYAMSDPLIYYNLGNDDGIQYSYIDQDLVNGYEYWYSISAYDGPDDWSGAVVDPMENAKVKNAFIDGDNTISIVPQGKSLGHEIGDKNITHTGSANAILNAIDAEAFVFEFLGEDEVRESDFVSKGYTYSVDFFNDGVAIDSSDENSANWDTTTFPYWTLTNTTTSETIVNQDPDVESGQMKYVVDGFIPVFSDASFIVSGPDTVFQTILDSVASNLAFMGGGASGPDNPSWGGFVDYLYGNYPASAGFFQPSGIISYKELGIDLQIRFIESGSIASYYNLNILRGNAEPDTIQLPIEIWDTENDQRLNIAVYQVAGNSKPSPPWGRDSSVVIDSIFTDTDTTLDSSWAHYYKLTTNLQIIPIHDVYTGSSEPYHFANDADLMGWVLNFNTNNLHFNYGDMLDMVFPNPIVPGEDQFEIITTEDGTSPDLDLSEILVVPNPYVVTSAYEYIQYQKEIQFTRLPEECMIRIYNSAGELVQILNHKNGSPGYRGASIEAWDLRTYNNQDVAFGVYIFHVVSGGLESGNEHIGKFAVIK